MRHKLKASENNVKLQPEWSDSRKEAVNLIQMLNPLKEKEMKETSLKLKIKI